MTSPHRPVLLVALVPLAVLASCAGPRALDDRMFDHFSRAAEIQSALMMGDLERARRPARWLAEDESFGDLGAGAQGWIDAMRAASLAVAEAESVNAAADATGRLAAVCAGCHTASADGPTFLSMASPPDGGNLGTHMIRHLWAMDRLWEGLIGASGDTWRMGALALAEEEPAEGFPGSSASAAAAMAQALHDQAERAERTPAGDRPAAYADLIKTCAGCHALSPAGAY